MYWLQPSSTITTRLCPIHHVEIKYDMASRTGKCSAGGEVWHRDVAAVRNILLRAAGGDGSSAPSPQGPIVIPRSVWERLGLGDGRPVALASTGAHEVRAILMNPHRGPTPAGGTQASGGETLA